MRGASCAEIGTGFSSRRLRLAFFLPRMWLVIAWRPPTLALAVSLKRFLAPEWVFILGMRGLIQAERRISSSAAGCGSGSAAGASGAGASAAARVRRAVLPAPGPPLL